MFDRLKRLPSPQCEALQAAFGLKKGPAPDRFLVGLAVLSLFSCMNEERPLLCVVDDAQWLDRESVRALAFAARRLRAERVLVVFATCQSSADLQGLGELTVQGLSDVDARDLLASLVRWPLDQLVLERIVAEARGNPRALLELTQNHSEIELAGGFGLSSVMPLSTRWTEGLRRHVEALPAQTRRLLQIAAADPVGDPALVWRAAALLGVPAQAAIPAAGVLEFATYVRFRPPLLRSALYWSASVQERQDLHLALAEATDPEVDPDRRAWHRANATPGRDEDVAAELERSAGRALARGCLAVAAQLLERAAALTPAPGKRCERSLDAAQAKVQVGAFNAALDLLGLVEAGPLDDLQRARVDLLHAQLAFVSNRDSDAQPFLLNAATALERAGVDLARETCRKTLSATMFAGHLATPGEGVLEVFRTAGRASPAQGRQRAPELLVHGLTAQFAEGCSAGVPILEQALGAFGREMSAAEELRWLSLACIAALQLWDDARWDVLSRRHVELARKAGALSELPLALNSRAYLQLFAGELTQAATLVGDAHVVTQAIGVNLAPHTALGLAALQGREEEVLLLGKLAREEAAGGGEEIGAAANWARAVLYNGLGRYDEAVAAAERGSEYADELGLATWSMAELIEAAARTGEPGRAAGALGRLSEISQATATDWALGVAARSRALLADGEAAEGLYREAIERLAGTCVSAELARGHLLYGEWLRRQNRRLDAREQLRGAYDMLTGMGIQGFAERARRELLATGETIGKRSALTPMALTAQEGEIARLACDGHTNPEIAGLLFISPRTVEWHLRKVFRKLDISSRRQLRLGLSRCGSAA
jgi:DNA-binding CsgD family transcriptional regulator/tetratricopeptide (TPR) repeat protein